MGHQDGSVGKSTCHQTWWPEFELQDQYSRRRKLTLLSYPLTATHASWYTHHTHTHTHRHACIHTCIHTCTHTNKNVVFIQKCKPDVSKCPTAQLHLQPIEPLSEARHETRHVVQLVPTSLCSWEWRTSDPPASQYLFITRKKFPGSLFCQGMECIPVIPALPEAEAGAYLGIQGQTELRSDSPPLQKKKKIHL